MKSMEKVMQKWKSYGKHFQQNRLYMGILLLTAVCAYGYKVTNATIGIDDTPSLYYFEEGLIAIVGRWVLFLLNKVVSLAEFVPFVTDFAAVVILVLAAVVWSALFYSVLGEKVPTAGYAFFGAVFLSSPLISEVFTYFLHNGIAIGYLCCGISLCCVREWQSSTRKMQKGSGIRQKLGCLAVAKILTAAVFLWIAMGCYESFMILWLAGLMLLLLTERIARGRQEKDIFATLVAGAVAALVAIVLRSVMIVVVTKAFHLEYLRGEAVQRSVTEMLGWMLQPGAFGELAMILKRTFVLYGVFAYAYLPIRIFILSAAVILVVTLVRVIRGRDLWALLLLPAAYLAAFSLLFIEGKATLYRSAQFLPVFCGYGALLFVYGIWQLTGTLSPKAKNTAGRKISAGVRALAVLVLAVILWNQCMDMTRWFYIDKKKDDAGLTKTRKRVLVAMSAMMVAVIIIFYYLNNDSAINAVYSLAAYTYGPILGMFIFGLACKKQVRDKWVPAVCIISPIICLILQKNSEQWFNGYQISFELLIINAVVTALGMALLIKKQ